MKKRTVILCIFISALFGSQTVFAQDGAILLITPVESGIQQGRVLLDSDTNEGQESQLIQTTTSDVDQEGTVIPSSESSGDGDPDQPVVTGQLYNGPEEVGGESEDIGAPVPETTGIDNEDIGITDDNKDEPSEDSQSGSQVAPSQTKVIILAPSADDDASTHDPSITILESLVSIGIDEDDFGFISGEQVYVRAGFVKLGDIKGESSDEPSTKGNVEAIYKVEEGEASKKPKEIVVVGSKDVDKSSPKLFEALCSGLNATCEPEGAVTPETLEDFAQRTVNTFQSVNEIRMDDTKIEMEGTQPFKLFGVFSMRMKQTAIVSIEPDSFGRVKVKFPWYRFLGRATVSRDQLKTYFETGISTTQVSKWEVAELDAAKSESTARPSETITFNFSEVKAQILQTMSNTLAQYHESDYNFIQR